MPDLNGDRRALRVPVAAVTGMGQRPVGFSEAAPRHGRQCSARPYLFQKLSTALIRRFCSVVT